MFELNISNIENGASADKALAYKIVSFRSNGKLGAFFITNLDGEGMEVSEKDLFDIIDKYFKEKF